MKCKICGQVSRLSAEERKWIDLSRKISTNMHSIFATCITAVVGLSVRSRSSQTLVRLIEHRTLLVGTGDADCRDLVSQGVFGLVTSFL